MLPAMPVLSKRCVPGIVALTVSTLTLALALLPYLMGVQNALQRPRLDCKQETIPLYPTFPGARVRNLSDSEWIASRETSTTTNFVLAAILNAHAHSIPALWSVYGPHFWDVVFINPKMTPTEQAELGMRGIKALTCGDGFNKVYDINYKCVAGLIHDFMKPIDIEDDPEDPHLPASSRWSELQGLLAFHADLWLSPLVFATAAFAYHGFVFGPTKGFCLGKAMISGGLDDLIRQKPQKKACLRSFYVSSRDLQTCLTIIL